MFSAHPTECIEQGKKVIVKLIKLQLLIKETYQLVSLNPDDFVDSFVPPQLQTLTTELHGAASHPQKD
jgi:hypothetical protein